MPTHSWLHVTASPIGTANITRGDDAARGEHKELPCVGSSLGTKLQVMHLLSPKMVHVAAARIDSPVFGQCGYSERALGSRPVRQQLWPREEQGILGLSRLPAAF